MANEKIPPTGMLSAGITVKIDWNKSGDQWHATARANMAPVLADYATTYGNADDPTTATMMAVAALVARARAFFPAGPDRVPVSEDSVERIATAVADRVAEKLGRVTAREAVEPAPAPAAVEPKRRYRKSKNGRRRRAQAGVTKVIGAHGRRRTP